jgi:hypothetical protein
MGGCPQMEGHSYFGRMRVGSVVDCLAVDGEEVSVIAVATRFLQKEKADIIISKQMHNSWRKAFSSNGYIQGPSDFTFAASPKLSERLHPFEANRLKIQMTRGDHDGPIKLMNECEVLYISFLKDMRVIYGDTRRLY